MSERHEGHDRSAGLQPLAGVEFNVGIDMESHERFEHLGESRGATLRYVFDSPEIDYCERFENAAERFAGTWCAKEAVVKAAWPWVHLEPRRVTIGHSEDGAPHASIVEWDADAVGLTIRVSVSHTDGQAIAAAIVWGPTGGAE